MLLLIDKDKYEGSKSRVIMIFEYGDYYSYHEY